MSPDFFAKKSVLHQRGFLLPLALFILVVMAALAVTISRTSTQTQTSSIQEFTNIQSIYAAESGAQRGMQALFLNTATRQATDTACANMAINQNFAGVGGLQICAVQVNCVCRYRDNTNCNAATAANYATTAAVGVTVSFYTLTSVGACGAQQFRATRTVQVGSYREQ
jgi:MSHA biogenesis protein MshP